MVRPFAVRPATKALRKKISVCSHCTVKTATVEALFRIEGAVFVRKYCNKCLPEAEFETDH